MDNIFTTLLTLSWQAGVIALAVALVRLPLRRAPRWAVCALWALVALRLLLPVTIESPVSLQAEEAPPIRVHRAQRSPNRHPCLRRRARVPDPYAAVAVAHRRGLYAALHGPQLPAYVGQGA